MQIHRYDVVIVGAGGAGMRAALESSTRARTAATLLAALSTEGALASVAAAPAGAPAVELMPRVLEELRAAEAAPAVEFLLLKPEDAAGDVRGLPDP